MDCKNEEIFHFLNSTVPSNIESVTFSCNSSLNETRKEIIRKHRIVNLYNYSLVHIRDDKDPDLSDQRASDGIFNHTEVNTFIGVSQLSQNASFLLSYLLTNPDVFAKAVLDYSKVSNRRNHFKHIIFVSIPSFYGFFSSSEQLDYAHCFYYNIVDLATDQEFAAMIIEPFLTSVASFRFLESALTRFFDQFLLESVPKTEEEMILLSEKYSPILLDYLTSSVSLLPEQILQLFTAIQSKNWSPKVFANLVLVRFIWPAALRWLEASHCTTHRAALKRVISSVGIKKDLLRNFYHALFHTRSTLGTPFLFQDFNMSSIMLYVCVNDILLIAKLLNSQNLLSKSGVDISDFKDIERNYKFTWFWCHAYPKTSSTSKPQENKIKLSKRIVFDNYKVNEIDNPEFSRQFNAMYSVNRDFSFLLQHSGNGDFYNFVFNECLNKLIGGANSFESLMALKQKQKALFEWKNVAECCLSVLVESNLKFFSGRPTIMEKMPNRLQGLCFISKIVQTTKSKINEELSKRFEEIGKFGEKWEKMFSNIEIQNVPYSEQIINEIKSLQEANLLRKYKVIMQVMKEMHIISSAKKIKDNEMRNILKKAPGEILLKSYVQIHVLIAKETYFTKLRGKEESNYWQMFEGMILKCISKDKDMASEFFSKQIELSEYYDKVKGNLVRNNSFGHY